jgi:hypothetical protein
MRSKLFCGAAVISLLLAGVPADAHHSIAAEYDQNKPVKVRGVVTSMRWANPHAWLYLDVNDPDGKVSHWGFELGGLNALYRQGWRKENLPVGAEIIVEGFLSKTDPHVGNSQSITLPNGQQLLSGTAPAKGETGR